MGIRLKKVEEKSDILTLIGHNIWKYVHFNDVYFVLLEIFVVLLFLLYLSYHNSK